MVKVVLDGYVVDELSTARDGVGPGISSAWIDINGESIVIKDEFTDLLDEDGYFSIVTTVRAVKGAVYHVALYAADTTGEDAGGPNSGLVDETTIKVPHDMSGKTKAKKNKKAKKSKKVKKK